MVDRYYLSILKQFKWHIIIVVIVRYLGKKTAKEVLAFAGGFVGSAQALAGDPEVAVQGLQLPEETLVGVNVAARAHLRHCLGQGHAALYHQERDRARRRAGDAHHAVHQHTPWKRKEPFEV